MTGTGEGRACRTKGTAPRKTPASLPWTTSGPVRRRRQYVRAIDSHDLVFGTGPAGTGKTYLAVAKAVERLVNGEVDRIILSRPAVEAGEQLGFLPGSMREKVDPYLRPLYDALYDMLPAPQVIKRLEAARSRWRRLPLCVAGRSPMRSSSWTRRRTPPPCR